MDSHILRCIASAYVCQYSVGQGVPLVKISALLGHSSIHTTFEFYCETMNDEASIRDFMNMKFVPGGEA